MRVRLARATDAAAIASIYNQGIEDHIGTFETDVRTKAMVVSWFDDMHPIVVVEQEGEIIAYASTSSYRSRPCYAGIAEFSVYVRRDWRGKGAGHLALSSLMQECETAGLWKLVSRIFVENSASRRLMRRLGFREVGIYEKHGQLDGVWRDVVIVEYLFTANLMREYHAQIANAQPLDVPQILALLERCSLPLQGVADVRETTVVARKDGKVVGCTSLEVYGTVALLRSVAVHPAYRSRQLGQQLVQAILDHARSLRIHEVYLLTETASEYFPRFGFRLIDRSAVAPVIQHSVEWEVACPVSAYAMVLHLNTA
jgi:L-amino acid N-acyltransferase YncA